MGSQLTNNWMDWRIRYIIQNTLTALMSYAAFEAVKVGAYLRSVAAQLSHTAHLGRDSNQAFEERKYI